MTKVYVVTYVDGQCGEGFVYGVWSTREAADLVAEKVGGRGWECTGVQVTELTLDADKVEIEI